MILDALGQAARYGGLHPGFGQSFEFLMNPRLAELSPGKHEIDGQRLFVIISHDPGRGRAGAKLEAHRKYIDIQHVVRGTDDMGWQPLAACRNVETRYDEQRDIAFFGDQPEAWISVGAGQFVIFWPEDAHAPLAGEGDLVKAVVKVAVQW
jgi:YhcH/YjgK/YiaL family protein